MDHGKKEERALIFDDGPCVCAGCGKCECCLQDDGAINSPCDMNLNDLHLCA